MNLRDPNLPFNLTSFRALQDELRRMDAARLEPQEAALAQALRNVLTILKTINEDPEGAINDTLWYSDHETLFDYIENTLTAAPLAARQAEQQAGKIDEFARLLDALIEHDADRAERFIEKHLARLGLKKRLEARRSAQAPAVADALAAQQAERAELRRLAAHLHELRELLDRRPAINQSLFEAYQKWSGEVYALDWLNALDTLSVPSQGGIGEEPQP